MGWEWSGEAENKWRDEIYAFYGDGAAEELDAIPSHGSGMFFSSALVESCMDASIPVFTWKCDDKFVHLPEDVRRSAAEDRWSIR